MTDIVNHKCAYCGATKPESEMEQKKVRHYHTQRHLDKFDWYCRQGAFPDDPKMSCASAMQMSLEG
jgi:hypothetical protein